MDTVLDCTVYVSQQEQPIASRVVAAQALGQFDQLDSPWTTVSQVARELGVPDSTLRYWRQKR
jgi:transposase-like protein